MCVEVDLYLKLVEGWGGGASNVCTGFVATKQPKCLKTSTSSVVIKVDLRKRVEN